MPAPWEQYQQNTGEPSSPWENFKDKPSYGYLQPDEGATSEDLHFDNSGDTISAPVGTGENYSFIQNDVDFDTPSSSFEEAGAMFEKQAAYIALVANAYGLVGDDDINQFVADRSQALASAQARQPEYMKEFNRQFEDAEGFFETAGVFLSNPRAIGRQVITQSPNSALPLLTTAGGAVGGTAIGGTVGSAVPVVGTAAGGVVGGITGGTTGAFAGGSIIEIGAEIDGMLAEAGIDVTDANQVLQALQNDEFMNDIKIKAQRKGLTTASVDALFQVFGGRFVKAAKVRGAGKVGTAGAVAADIGVQSFGEGAGEAAGQFAKDGQVNFKEAALEAVTAISQSAGQTAIGASVGGVKEAVSRETPVTTPEQAVIDAVAPEVTQIDLAAKEQSLERLQQIDTSGLDEQSQQMIKTEISRRVLEIEDIKSAVEQKTTELNAQEGRGFLPVPKRPETLSQFLKKMGGLKDDTEEAKRFTRKESPNLKGVANRNGKLSLDEARRMAVGAGFLSDTAYEDGVSTSTPQDLLDALEREAFGEYVVRDADQGALLERDQILEFNDQQDQANAEIMSNTKEIKSFRMAFKEGVRAAKKDVKASQEAIISALEKSALRPEDRAKFIRAIKNTQTPEQLRKAAPDISNRVEKLLNADALRKQKKVLAGQLSSKSIATKTQSNKKVGKFDASTQARLEELKSFHSMNQEQAQVELSRRLDENNNDALANRILNIKAYPDRATATDVAIAVAEVKAIKQFGLAMAEARMNTVRSRANNLAENIINFQAQQDPDALTRKTTGLNAAFTGSKQAIRSGISLLAGSWGELIDRVAPANLVDELGVRREISKQKEIMRVMTEKLLQAAKDAYGDKSPKQILKDIEAGNKIEDLGVFVNIKGEEVRLERSRSQVRKIWMEAQNEKIREQTLQSENGNAYTDEMMQAMFSILTDEDYQFAQSQLDIYDAFYDQVNEVYSRVFGVNLGKQEFYSPIRRDADATDSNQDAFLREQQFRRTLADPSAVKLRDQKASAALMVNSDIAVFNSHIASMARFIAFREKMQLLDAVFKRADVRNRIKASHGSFINSEISETLEFMSGAGRSYQTIIDKQIDYLNRNFATAQLGLKAKIGLTQLSSYPAYADYIPTKALLAGTADFFLNYKKAIKILGSTELMLDRGASVEVDISRMGKTFDNGFVKKVKDKKANFIDMALIFTKFGDRAAIYAGGWAVYKHAIDQGKTHEQAVAAFEDATSETQQSKDIDQISFLQRSNAITRGLAMFMTAPIAQFRGEVRAIRRYGKGEITKAQLAKGLIIYHVLIPQIYQALANGIIAGEFDEDDQLRTLLFGSLAGIPIIGDVLNTAAREIQGKYNMPKDNFKWATTMKDAFTEAFDAMSSGKDGDWEDAIDAMIDLSKSAAELKGLPVDGAGKIFDGLNDIADGEIKKGSLGVAGFPKSVTGSGKKDDKKKSNVSNPF